MCVTLLADTSFLGRHPPAQTPTWADIPQTDTPWLDTPLGRHPLPRDSYCSRRYASYWNAFLFGKIFCRYCMKIKEIELRGGMCLTLPSDPPIVYIVSKSKWSLLDGNFKFLFSALKYGKEVCFCSLVLKAIKMSMGYLRTMYPDRDPSETSVLYSCRLHQRTHWSQWSLASWWITEVKLFGSLRLYNC